MPRKLELKLKKEAFKKFGTTKSKPAERYIYGTLYKIKLKSKR
jgi:hypothetical protein